MWQRWSRRSSRRASAGRSAASTAGPTRKDGLAGRGHALPDRSRCSSCHAPPTFEAELEAIKAHSRDSPDAYVEAEPKLSAARLAFERTLIETGAGQLILGESSDGAGAFRFQRVPEGAWMLLAWRETPHAKRPPALKRGEAERYKTRPQVFGQTTVTFWWRPVIVKAGEEATVRLHDRNEWLTGVREDRRVPDAGRAGHSPDAAGRRPPLEERRPG